MKTTPLNMHWSFQKGFEEDWTHMRLSGQTVHLPHTVKEIADGYFDETITQGIFTYQQSFTYKPEKGRRLFVLFEGVMARAEIYLNGTHIGGHIGGYDAFQVELTASAKEQNILTVKVDSRETGDHPPFGGVIDYLTYGGIYREVSLIETGPVIAKHLLIDGDGATLNVRIEIDGRCQNRQPLDLVIKEGDTECHRFRIDAENGKATLKTSHDLVLWDVDNPKMYQAELMCENEVIASTRFGVRTIAVDKNGLYLNGRKIFLRGLNRHQSYPYVGYAMPKSAQARDADILKRELGCHIVRSSHYPPSRHFLDRCDDIGLLVFTELPGWQHIGDDAWKAHALKSLETMMIRDYNHPSVIMIGTRINESPDDDVFYQATRDLAKSIDVSRPTGGVRYIAHSKRYEDVYTVNDFVHHGDNEGLTPKKKMTKQSSPYLVTEYNGHVFPTKSYDDETKRVTHAHRHFKVLDDAYQMKGLMGAIGWCMNDYHTHKDFGSNDHVCHHGVLDINRNDKYAASVYASQGEKPYMKVLSMMHIGDLPGGALKEVMVATNCDEIKLYKNEQLVGTYNKENAPYPHLPHPPIIIRDLIGNLIRDNETFKKKDADTVKEIMLKTLHNDLKMSLGMKLKLGWILFKYKLKYEDAVKLYTRYIGGWGESGQTWRFEGYQQGKRVLTEQKGKHDDYQLSIKTDAKDMHIETTYDVMRITVELANSLGERAYYSKEVIHIETTGNLTLIGPAHRSMQGGIQSFWVKAVEPGTGSVKVVSQHFNTVETTVKTT